MEKIRIDKVNLHYGAFHALKEVSTTIPEHAITAFIGPSGCGKSTLLNMLGGLDRPSAGSLYVDGVDLLKFTEKDFIEYKRKTVGFVWQNNARNLIPYLTAKQNVEMPMLLSGFSGRSQRADELLDMVGLSHRKNSRLDQMSGGEQQRVAIAIALSNNPKLLLADEVHSIIRREGCSAVLVTHDISEAISMCDRIIVLTSRPATVRCDVEIRLKEDSPLARRNDAAFKDYFNLVWEEMMKNEEFN